MYYVYLIKYRSPKRWDKPQPGKWKYYTGYTNNPQRRWKEHHQKGGYLYRYIKENMVVILFMPSIAAAMKKEKYWKNKSWKEKNWEYNDYFDTEFNNRRGRVQAE
jgi:predicted GIY-YIG superfamily endonuclease